MKVQALFIAFVLYSNFGTAQIVKNNWLVGGQLSFDHTKTKVEEIERTNTVIQGKPQAGYFILDKLAAGIQFDLIRSSSKSNTKSVATTFGIGPFVRYYFLPSEKRVNIVTDARAAFYVTSNSQTVSNSKFTSYSCSAGPVVFLNSSVAIELLMGYTGYTEPNSTQHGIRTSLGIQVHLERDR